MTRFRVLAALAAAAVAAGVYAAFWNALADRARAAVETWAAQRRAAGWTVESGPLTVGGFPLAVTVRGDGVRIGARGWRWRAPAVTATVRPWAPGTVAVDAPGAQEIALLDGGLVVAASGAEAGLTFDGGALRAARLAVPEALVREGPEGPLPATGRIEGRLARMDGAAGSGAASFGFALSIAWPSLPDAPPAFRGAGRLSAEGVARDLPPAAGSPARYLRDWRAGGGAVDLDSVALDWKPFGLSGDGTVALDGRLQPEAALTLGVRGFRDAVAALVSAGAMRPGTALAVTLAAGALAGGEDTVRVPVTVQNRTLSVGPVPVLEFGAIGWE